MDVLAEHHILSVHSNAELPAAPGFADRMDLQPERKTVRAQQATAREKGEERRILAFVSI